MAITSDALKVPPHDTQAEQSVLGAVLIDPSAIHLVINFLKSDHFYHPDHRHIYSAMISLFEQQQPIDVVTLKNQLKKDPSGKNLSNPNTLADLINIVPTSAYVEHYGRIVKDNYTKRRLIELSSRTIERAFDGEDETKNMLDHAEMEIFSLSQEQSQQDFIELKEVLTESLDRLEEFKIHGGEFRGIPTGYTDLDRKLSGLHPSNLLILAARPGIGKTSFALNIALNAALQSNAAVGFFSLEMSKEELVDRLLVGHADIDAWKLKTGKLSTEDYEKLTEAMGDLSNAQIFIDDTPGISILEMRTKARRLKLEHNLKLLFVDYLQLADAGKRFESRVQEVSHVSQGLKNLARELKIPVVALSQLSRAVEQRGTKKPQLADLRESGAIEQDADVVMFIYSEDDQDDLLDESKRTVKLSIAKHRAGATGEIDLIFRGDRVKFYSVDHAHTI